MRSFKILNYPSRWNIFRIDDRLLLIFIGFIVGSCSGLAAVALSRSLTAILNWLHPYRHIWWAFLLPAAGAALSSLFMNKIVKEGAGHGVPEVIYSVSRYGGLLRLRSSYSRLISSCLTIGSGGSAGPEAPIVMSGAAIGSNIAKFFSLNDRQRVTLVGCGAAGAISSIFNAPIAGMVFTIEVILGEWTALNIVPIAIASVAGTEISRFLQGNNIAFKPQQFNIGAMDIIACVGLALVTAAASVLLTRALRGMHKISARVPVSLWLRAAIGGGIVGGIGIFMPVVLGEGYHFIQEMIDGTFSQGLIIAAIATLAKIFATSFTLGWGGSGGIFAPGLVIGSLAGITYHRFLVWLWPSAAWVNEGCFALLGMAGLIGGMLQAPLTGIFLIVEITGGYQAILPLIIVSAMSSTMCHYIEPASFYFKELVDKGQLLRPRTDARILSDLKVQELLERDCISVHQNMLLRDFIDIVKISHRNFFPVEDEDTGEFIGMIHLDDIRAYLFNPVMYDAVILEQIMNTRQQTVHLDDDLSVILRTMDEKRLFSMPVVSSNRFIGMISKATLLDQYRKELRVQTFQ
ncbi:Chloride channel family protein [Desulfonema limicola]|uniref:Chloride channel family protein n=1 Tax=Desulfonema limicola TaxID=45656 RepID=A0A975BC82_9BACT|nr:chloride channel protein [Desulfonema limicola]QTA82939.1 Chloride channel family protein [Desulfonema limicola]